MKHKYFIGFLIIAFVIYSTINHYNKRKQLKNISPLPDLPFGNLNSNTSTKNVTDKKPTTTVPKLSPLAKYPLHYGSVGKNVSLLQVLVGVQPSGTWANLTQNAVKVILNKSTLTEKEFCYVLIAGMQAYNNKEFDYGSSGNHIKALQVVLNMPVTGKFDTALEDKLEMAIGKRTIAMKDFEQLVTKELSLDIVKYKQSYTKEYILPKMIYPSLF